MALALCRGLVMWKSRGSQSTLDLFFVSESLEKTVVQCNTADELESSSEHLPLLIELRIILPKDPDPTPNRNGRRPSGEKSTMY